MFRKTVMLCMLLLSSAACSDTTTVVEPETPSPVAASYRVATYNGAALPVVISDESFPREDGSSVNLVEKFEQGNVSITDAYQVELQIGLYERTTSNGTTVDRLIRRSFVRDRGQLRYNWLDGTGIMWSEMVGGLSHRLANAPSGPRVAFRIGGTDDVWTLDLQRQQ